MEEFADINRAMEKTGTFTMTRKKLFQLVGKANSNLADVILKVGLFERYSINVKSFSHSYVVFYDLYICAFTHIQKFKFLNDLGCLLLKSRGNNVCI